MPNAQCPTPRSAPRRAFTLVELMVSVAMVLIIILGVNAIFKMASDTVNAGQALASANRDNRAVQTVLFDDFRTAVITDGPLLLIRSERVAAFRNREDELSDRDFDPAAGAVLQDQQIRTTDFDANNNEGEAGVRGEVTPPLVYNSRNHRIDRVSFFGNNLYRRQTGTEGAAGTTFIDDGTSFEAYHWYGHLDQPNGVRIGTSSRFNHQGPGEPRTTAAPNANNYYATDWTLGRSITLLKEDPVPVGTTRPPNFFPFEKFDGNFRTRLSPLNPGALANANDAGGAGTRDYFRSSRYDLAQTSINFFRQALMFDIANNNGGSIAIDAAAPAWYEILGGGDTAANLGLARFEGYAYPDRPLSPYGLARTVPVFVRGCTQFTVEYAGDYLNQDPTNGAIVGNYLSGAAGTDGQIDYMYVVEQTHPSEPMANVRRIRWYGMPRNVDTRDDVAGPVIAGAPAATPKAGNLYDVIPLRDLLSLTPGFTGLPADFFEHFDNLAAAANYAGAGAVPDDPRAVRYYAAWGPNDLAKGSPTRPKMIRITMTVDDPNGRMTEGQTFEYVIDLQ